MSIANKLPSEFMDFIGSAFLLLTMLLLVY